MSGRTGADARTTASALARSYDVSEQTVYRLSADVRPSRRRRSDAGARSISDAAREEFLSLAVGKGLSVALAREMMEEVGWTDLPSAQTLSRLLRDRRVSARERDKDLTPCVRFEATRPNELWQIDASGSTMFYQDADGSIVYINPIRHTRNKPQPDKPRVWLTIVEDDYSRALWAQITPGNDTQTWLTVFGNAAREKDAAFPFCGLPEKLYSDQDAIVRSARFQRILGLFDPPVEHMMHLPHHSRATGKVERLIGTIKSQFEARHRALYVPGLEGEVDQKHHEPTRWRSLDEANAALDVWLRVYNNRKHSSTGQAPFARWVQGVSMMAARGMEVRVVDDATLNGVMLVDEAERRVNRDLTVSLNNTRYALPRHAPFIDMIDKRIRVWWSPEIEGSVWADVAGESFELHPVGVPIAAGTFRAIELSKRDETRRAIARGADPLTSAPPAAATRTASGSPDIPVRTASGSPDIPVGAGSVGTPYVHRRPVRAVMPDVPTPTVVMKTRTQALTWLRQQRAFHTPVAEWELAAFDAFIAGRDAVEFAELRRFAEHHRAGGSRTAVGAAS